MNNIQVFENKDFGAVRTVEIDNAPWFVGKDVASILGYSRPDHAIGNHVDEGDKLMYRIDTSGQNRQMLAINESGLYSLILSSKLPKAKQFKHWVTSEVLPSIRKHGMYAVDELLDNPDFMIKAMTALKQEREEKKQLQAENSKLLVENQIMKPKAEYFDELVDKNLLTSFRDTAKELKVGERMFIALLLRNEYIYKDKQGRLKPYSKKNNGLFELKESVNEKTGWTSVQTLITPKGRETFRLLIAEVV